MSLMSGEPVRYIDATTFEIVATGELLKHDLALCTCKPEVKVSTFEGMAKVRAGRNRSD